MLDRPRILSISNSFDKFSNTWALILDPLFSTLAHEIKHPFYVAYVNSEYPDHLPQNAASELYLLFAHWISYFRKVALNYFNFHCLFLVMAMLIAIVSSFIWKLDTNYLTQAELPRFGVIKLFILNSSEPESSTA